MDEHVVKRKLTREVKLPRQRMRRREPRKVPGAQIQWHLDTSQYDCCPDCGSSMGYLSRRERVCVKCRVIWRLSIPATKWWRMQDA